MSVLKRLISWPLVLWTAAFWRTDYYLIKVLTNVLIIPEIIIYYSINIEHQLIKGIICNIFLKKKSKYRLISVFPLYVFSSGGGPLLKQMREERRRLHDTSLESHLMLICTI